MFFVLIAWELFSIGNVLFAMQSQFFRFCVCPGCLWTSRNSVALNHKICTSSLVFFTGNSPSCIIILRFDLPVPICALLSIRGARLRSRNVINMPGFWTGIKRNSLYYPTLLLLSTTRNSPLYVGWLFVDTRRGYR